MVSMKVRFLYIPFIVESLMIRRHLIGAREYVLIEYTLEVERTQSTGKLLNFSLFLNFPPVNSQRYLYPNFFSSIQIFIDLKFVPGFVLKLRNGKVDQCHLM